MSACQWRIVELEVEGFKSFKERTRIGPLGGFTAIVGPNGCGKSVVGEAIAWALGGTRHMLRAKNLASLINSELRAAGVALAQVTVTFAPCDVPAAHAGGGPEPLGAAAEGAPAAGELRVRKTLRGSQSSTHICRGAGAAAAWQPASQAQLQQELAACGIQTEVVDRYVVSQARQAVDVSDPRRLARHLEVLIGTDGYEARIAEQEAALRGLASDMGALEEEAAGLQATRERLAPMVQRWREHQAASRALRRREAALLTQQAADADQRLSAAEAEAKQAAAAEATSALEAAAAKQAAAELGGLCTQLGRSLASARREHQAASSQASSLGLAAARAAAEVEAAAAAGEADEHLRAKLGSKLAKLQAQQAQGSAGAEDGQAQLQRLQEAQQQAAAALAALGPRPGGEQDSGLLAGLEAQLAAGRAAVEQLAASMVRLQAAATSAESKLAACQQRLQQMEAAAAGAAAAVQLGEEQQGGSAAALREAQAGQQEAAAAWQAAHLRVAARQRDLAAFEAGQAGGAASSQAGLAIGAAGGPGHGPSHATKFDQAVAALKQLGQLPGRFYGRLCNVAAVTEAAAEPAVNAVLREACSLSATLVVSDRETAAAVVRHFREGRVGIVTCRILAELPPAAARPGGGGGGGAGSSGMRPLADLVRLAGGMQEVQPLLDSLLSSWRLVEGRQAAVRLREQQQGGAKGLSLVTRAGELFKGNGEIVCGGSDPSGGGRGGGYGLGLQPSTIRPPTAAPGAHPERTAAAPAAAAAQAAAAERRRQLQFQLAEAQAAAAAEERRLAAAWQLLGDAQERATAAQRSTAAAARQLPAKERPLAAARQEVSSARQRLEQAQAQLRAQAAAQQQQVANLAALQGRVDAARQQLRGGRQPDPAAVARAALAAVNSQLAAARAQSAQAVQQEARLGSQAAAVLRQLGSLQAPEQRRRALKKLQAKQADLAAKAAHQEQKATAATGQLADTRRQAGDAERQLAAAVEEAEAAGAQLTAAQARLARVQAAASAARQLRARLQARLDGVRTQLEADGDEAAAGGAEAGGSAEGGGGGPGADEGRGGPGKRRRRGGGGHGAVTVSEEGGGGAGVGEAAAWAQQEEAEVADEQARLDQVEAGIDVGALRADLAAAQRLLASGEQLAALEAVQAAAAVECERLRGERYGRLAAALEAAGGQLRGAYQALTGGAGDAYLGFTLERQLLFTEGVTLHARPGGCARWRPFAQLSGGQQSLAALALSFGLQACFPSPFFFFDEIDAALDTSHAARVGEYILAHCHGAGLGSGSSGGGAVAASSDALLAAPGADSAGGALGPGSPAPPPPRAQYLVVSHRPQVFEKASCLLGVYTLPGGATGAAVMQF